MVDTIMHAQDRAARSAGVWFSEAVLFQYFYFDNTKSTKLNYVFVD
jgi:hypothetical protein